MSKNDPLLTFKQKMLRKKEIDQKLLDYLFVKNTKLGRFYLLPKMHKRMIKFNWKTNNTK